MKAKKITTAIIAALMLLGCTVAMQAQNTIERKLETDRGTFTFTSGIKYTLKPVANEYIEFFEDTYFRNFFTIPTTINFKTLEVPNQKAALMALYNSLNGAQWTKKDNWGSDKPLNEWYGVSVDGNGFVWELNLVENNLSGTIPPEIGDFPKLQNLNFGYNEGIHGNIPPEIGKLKELEYLFLGTTNLSGEIPDEIYSLTELIMLDFGSSIFAGGSLTGELSPKIGQLTKLQQLYLFNNKFSGELPRSLGQLQSLAYFSIWGNSFTGTIPDEFGHLPNLQQFNIAVNKFSGIIPKSILDNPNVWRKHWANIIAFNNFDISNLTYFPAPDFTINDVTGAAINLGQEYRSNKYTILYSWQSWCGFATAFHPTLISLYNQYKSKGLDVIGYSHAEQTYIEMGMTDQMLKDIADEIGMPWRTLYITGNNYEAYSSMLIQGGSPTIHVVDKLGNIVFSTYAFAQSRNDLEAFLVDKLGEGSVHEYYASTDYSADGKVKTIQTHTAGEGIKLIFTGDAFTDKDHANGSFDMRVNQAVEAFFSEEPYKSLRDRFDVYSVAAVSKNREIVEDSETAFGTYFGSGTHMGGNDNIVFEYAQKAPGADMTKSLITVIVNSPNYSGTCWMYEDNAAISYCSIIGYSVPDFEKLVRHESGGHGFGKLLDEYAYSGSITTEKRSEFIHQRDNLGWGANTDITSDPAKIQWSFMLNDSRYKNVVGIYEGALTYATGAWRPTYNSIMHMNTEGYNAPSRFAIYKRIIRLSEGREASFEEFANFDAPNLMKSPLKTQGALKTDSWKPMSPPVFIKGSWKDAGK